jgi:hypothetical protein
VILLSAAAIIRGDKDMRYGYADEDKPKEEKEMPTYSINSGHRSSEDDREKPLLEQEPANDFMS